MTNPITTSTTDSQTHNNIMVARSRDRPNGNTLRKCILEGPYTPSTDIIPAVPATDDSPKVLEQTTVETILNMSPENKEHYQSEKEAIHLLLNGIGDEIFSTVDACKTARDMWIAIERIQQDKSLNIQDVKTNLFWGFGKFTSHDGESMESYYSKFYKMMNEMVRNNLTVATISGLTFHDPYYQAPKSHKSYAPPSKQSSSTRSNASTKYKGKEIAKPITSLFESASKEDSDTEQAQRDKDMQKNLALIAKYFKKIYKPTNNNLRTSLNSRNKNVDTFPRQSAEKGVPLQAEQADWLEDTDEEIDEQELEAHYSYMAKIQEVPTAVSGTDTEPLEKVQYDAEYNVFANKRQHSEQLESINNTCVVEKVDSNVISNSPDMCNNDIQTDQNVEECDDERVALANLIANLTLDTKENKKILKQLKKENASLTQELKECKSNLEEYNTTQDSCLIAL
ncbi:hypothetical protein Tco_0677850 [Tanacetum coccineum]|uniref:Gag-Pol polyprotein n=1 Tax=Tanacetum coccineum TaxID=301880 RepID=A0ABQ4XEQ1_9ASTR